MEPKDLELITKLLRYHLHYQIVFENRDLLRDQDLSYYLKLVEKYSTHDKIDDSKCFISGSSLDLTFLDEDIYDRLEDEEFFINTGRLSILFLSFFEKNVTIDKKFFNSIKVHLKELNLNEEEKKKFEDILNGIEDYAVSTKWRGQFMDQLLSEADLLTLISNPTVFIVRTLVRLWTRQEYP